MTDIASLGIEIKTDSVKSAADDLDRLDRAGAQAEQSATRTGNAWSAAADKMSRAGAPAERMAQSFNAGTSALKQQKDELAALIGRIDPVVGALGRLDAMEQELKKHATSGVLPKEEFDIYKAKIDAMRQSLGNASDQLTRTGNTAKQTAQALRMLPAQFTDIAVGLSTGQSPFTVMLQQGGQIKDMFGGIGPAFSAVGRYALGLVNPFTVAAAAVGALALAYKQGSDEQTAFSTALITTGGVAGVTTARLADIARTVSSTVGTTHEAADALAQLVSTGKIFGDQLQKLSAAAVAWEHATGTSVQNTIAQFVQLANDPVGASEKLNEQYHYLTAAVYEQIKALQDQGRTQEAANLAEQTYASALESRSEKIKDKLGYVERAWGAARDAAKQAWDAFLDIGRENTLDERIETLKKKIAQLEPSIPGAPAMLSNGQADELRKELADLQKLREVQKVGEDAKAAREGETQRVQQEGIAAEKQIAQIREASLTNAEKRQKEITDYLRNIDKIRTANPNSSFLDQEKIDKDIANIQAKYKDAQKPVTQDAGQKQLESLRQQYAIMQAQLDASGKMGVQQQALVKWEQELADLKQSKSLTADQKSLLASADLLTAQLKRNVALEKEIALQEQKNRILAYQDALSNRLTSQQQGYQQQLEGLGQGDKQRQRLQEQLKLEQDYQNQRAQLAKQLTLGEGNGGISKEQYDAELAALDAYHKDALKNQRDYYKKVDEAQSDWTLGAKNAFQNYLDAAADVASQSKNLFVDAFQGMEDALVGFVTTGKLSFSDLAKSILADMARIAVRAAESQALSAIFGSIGGGGGTGGIAGGTDAGGLSFANYSAKGSAWEGGIQAFAKGGAFTNSIVTKPTVFPFAKGAGLMGEAGPEAIVPLTRTADGSLGVRASGISGAADINVVVNIASDGSVQTSAQPQLAQQFGNELGKFVEQKYRQLLSRDLSDGGQIKRAMRGGYR